MADYNPSVALGINAPDPNQGLNTLSKVMGLGQQGLAIRGQQSQNVSLAAKAQIDSQTATENKAGAQLLSDPVGNGLVDGDGNPTKNAQKIIMQAMPTTGSQHYEGLLNGARSKIEFNKSVNNLASDERQEVASTIAGASADPNADKDGAKAQLDALVESKKGTPVYDDYKRIAATSQQIMDHTQDKQDQSGQIIPPGKEAWRNAGLTLGRTVIGAPAVVGASGIAAPQATTIDQGENIQPGTTAPPLQGGGFTPSGAPIKKTVPPGYTMLPNGQLARISGGATSATPIPVTGPPTPGPAPAAPGSTSGRPRTAQDDAPSPNAPRAVQEAYQTSVQRAQADLQTARDADKDYGTNTHVSQVIRKLSDNTSTGPGSSFWHTMLAGVPGAVSPEASNAGADYQTINAMLDRQAAMARQTMGLPNTNAGQASAETISGTTSYAPAALQTKNNLTQALVEGAHEYRQGLEKVGGFTTSPSPNAVNQFKQAWTQNFDPNVYRAMRAHDENDKKEQAALQKELGAAGFKALSIKARNLQSLSTTGTLPPQQ